MVTNSDELLEGFENQEALKKRMLLNVDDTDFSGTGISYYEMGDNGFNVKWKVQYAPLQLYLEVYLRFAGGILCLLFAALMFFIGNLGGIMTGIVSTAVCAFLFYEGYKLMNKEYEFDMNVNKFSLKEKGLFTKTIVINYNELKSFEIITTGTDDNWGLPLAINMHLNKIMIKGKPSSIKLLKGVLEVFLIKLNKMRKKQGKEDLIQIA